MVFRTFIIYTVMISYFQNLDGEGGVLLFNNNSGIFILIKIITKLIKIIVDSKIMIPYKRIYCQVQTSRPENWKIIVTILLLNCIEKFSELINFIITNTLLAISIVLGKWSSMQWVNKVFRKRALLSAESSYLKQHAS